MRLLYFKHTDGDTIAINPKYIVKVKPYENNCTLIFTVGDQGTYVRGTFLEVTSRIANES
jgi:hypothetical protein